MRECPTGDFRFLVVVAALLVAGCGALDPIDLNQCGNEVIDDTEDCDTHVTVGTCGEPGTERACRLLCEPNELVSGCPSTYGCGADGICRQSKGEFELSGRIELGLLPRMAFGDFDADGHDDLVTVTATSLEVHYGSPQGKVDGTFHMAPRLGQPVVGQLTEDRRADLAIFDDRGLDVIQGQSGRTMLSTVYPAIPDVTRWGDALRLVLLEARPATVDPDTLELLDAGDELLLAHDTEEGSPVHARLLRWSVEERDFVVLGELPSSMAAIVGEVQVGQLDEDLTTSPCDELVVAYDDPSIVVVLSPCSGTDWTSDPSLGHPGRYPAVRLPGGVPRDVAMADLNRDGHLDLLIGGIFAAQAGEDNPPRSLWIALGEGDGTFVSPSNGAANEAGLLPTDFGVDIALLAAADLNQDDQIDLVLSAGILMSVPASSPSPSWPPEYHVAASSEYGWHSVRIADFNGDGWLDVAAASLGWSRLDFFAGGEGWTPSLHIIPLRGPIGPLAVGDFDGNGLPDLAFDEGRVGDWGSSVAESEHTLTVCFGEPAGAPSVPVRMGEIGLIRQVTAGSFVDYDYDDLDDVFVVYERDGEPHIAVLGGSTDRQLWATYPLQADTGDSAELEDLPLVAALGSFDSPAGEPEEHRDMAALTAAWDLDDDQLLRFGSSHAWRLPMTANAEVAADLPSPPALPFEGLIASLVAAPLAAAIDLDGDRIDELVLLASWSDLDRRPELPQGALLVGRASSADGSGHWDFGAEGSAAVVRTTEVYCHDIYVPAACYQDAFLTAGSTPEHQAAAADVPAVSNVYDGQLEVGDVDGDGIDDLVALAYWPASSAHGFVPTSIVVWRNRHEGSLGLTQRLDLQAPMDANGVAYQGPLAFTLLQADGDPALEIAVSTYVGAYLADIDLEHNAISLKRVLEDELRSQKVAHGDFDGDGVSDLAMGTWDGVSLFLGVPELR